MDYFNKLTDLLKTEKEEDENQYKNTIEHHSIAEKRAMGVVWYPIAIRSQELGRGDYLTIEVERTTHSDIDHQFRFGSPVVFFSNHDKKTDFLKGVISHQNSKRIKLSLRTDELPEWASDGKLGIEVGFDNGSYDDMFVALKEAQKNSDSDFIKVLIGEKEPAFHDHLIEIKIPHLNQSQNEAIHKIRQAKELAIIHGPPGTGKTTTLIEAIALLSKTEKVLVLAPSNAAVDLLSERLSIKGINVLRAGNPSKVSERLRQLTLDYKISIHSYAKDIVKWRKQANEYKDMAHKYKRHFGKSERDQRKALFDEAHKLIKEIEKTENHILQETLERTQVVTATLIGSNHYSIQNLSFDTLVIDEAAQGIEPACWVGILKAKKLVLAGDHKQLPPTLKSTVTVKSGLGFTLFEKLIEKYSSAYTLLNTQYRSHPAIMAFSSRYFYDGKLLSAESTMSHKIDEFPLVFIDMAGSGYAEKPKDTSVVNEEEAIFLLKYLQHFVIQNKIDASKTIGIICPYRAQTRFIEEKILDYSDLKNLQISIDSIDSFQGNESDFVFLSLVRSNSEGDIGFLSDLRRMNVALTRAKSKLVVIGDSSTICSHPFYKEFVDFTQQNAFYESCWLYSDWL